MMFYILILATFGLLLLPYIAVIGVKHYKQKRTDLEILGNGISPVNRFNSIFSFGKLISYFMYFFALVYLAFMGFFAIIYLADYSVLALKFIAVLFAVFVTTVIYCISVIAGGKRA